MVFVGGCGGEACGDLKQWKISVLSQVSQVGAITFVDWVSTTPRSRHVIKL